jgi:hypothetical protein
MRILMFNVVLPLHRVERSQLFDLIRSSLLLLHLLVGARNGSHCSIDDVVGVHVKDPRFDEVVQALQTASLRLAAVMVIVAPLRSQGSEAMLPSILREFWCHISRNCHPEKDW